MARQSGITVDNNFVKGLVTEATGLSFPENACTETFDCTFRKTGEVVRRRGLDYESGYSLFTLTASRNNSAVSSFRWTGAGGDGNSTFIVVQVGQYLYFYSASDDLSANKHSTSVDMSSFAISGVSDPHSVACSFAAGDGKLFVVSPHINPFYVSYTPSTDTISSGTQIDIKIRDQKRLNVSFEGRPVANQSTVDIEHLYNLWNAGWAYNVEVDSGGSATDPIKDWDAARSDLPGPNDQWWFHKNADGDLDIDEVGTKVYDTSEVPVGHYIYSAFDIDRQSVTHKSSGNSLDTQYGRSDANTLENTSTSGRPSSVAFFANRVFYAGVDGDDYNSNIYFSQVVTDINKVSRCYQQNDPTSEVLADLLPTDGGVIVVPEIANIVHMEEAQGSLIVWASNGIWSITGSEGIGFTATDFSVRKISTLQNVANQSFVNLNGVPAWINGEGVWVLQSDSTLGSVSVTSLSKDTIQTWFEENVPETNIPYIKSTYNQKERLVYWLFRSTAGSSLEDDQNYDRCLVFNTETGAFYPWKLNTSSSVKVIGVTTVSGFSSSVEESQVIDGSSNTVIDSSSDNVVVNRIIGQVAVAGQTKFLTENALDQITFAEEADTDYLDWTTPLGTGVDYESYFITGYRIRGEGLRKQKTNYVRVHSRVADNSSVKVQGVWDTYETDGVRWSTEQQGYKSSIDQTYSERRLKIRGHGLSLQLKFKSEQGKPFNIIGWTSLDSVSGTP